MTGAFRVLRPASLEAAARLAGETGDGRFVAGGTALQLEWTRGQTPPAHLIDLGGIGDLSGVSQAGGSMRIGALTRLAAVERNALLREMAPLLVEAARTVAAPPVRNLATAGGNVAGRSGCLIPSLLVLETSVEIFRDGRLARLPLADWLAAPLDRADIVTAMLVPRIRVPHRRTHRKVGLRSAFSPSVIGAAGVLVPDDSGRIANARFAVGGGIVRPQRLRQAEALALGAAVDALDWRLLRDALVEEIDAPGDAFRSAHYRKLAAANAIAAGLGGAAALESFSNRPLATNRYRPAPIAPPAEVAVTRQALAGRWRVRPDMADKIAGRLPYLTDHRRPDMLVGKILRAGIPHARILSLDTSAAESLPGVAAVVTAEDVPGLNAYGIVVQDMPALCFDKVRYAGDAVAAVAAIDEATARRALALIRVEYQPLPVVDDMEEALAPGAPAVHATGNLQIELHFARGDVDEAIGRCAHVVEDVYVTPRQMHGFMETEGGYVVPEADGSLTVAAGGQYGLRDRMQLARILAMPEERIRVITSPTGGAFGGKDELTVQPALALLAVKAGRPVRLQLDRAESVAAGWKRNPMRIRMRTGCDAEGRILAQEVDLLSECGAYASLSPGVLETALERACGPYEIANVRTHGRLAYTNNAVCGAFRGFGANQMAYAVECQIARLAEMAGRDPIGMRRINLRKPGMPGTLGQTVAPTERLAEMLEGAAASELWRRPRGLSSDRAVAIGVGMAMNYQGTGLGSVIPDPGGGRLTLLADGRIEAAFGLNEMGQGVVAAIQASVAAVLGCDRDDVVPVVGDTGLTPESGSSTAARGIHVVWKVATLAGNDFGVRLRAAAGALLGRPADELALAPGGIREARSNSGEMILSFAELAGRLAPGDLPTASTAFEFPKTDWRTANASYLFAFGAALARVAVDRVTGEVRVLDFEQHAAAGPIVDPAGYLGQIEGGVVQGIGFTLTEDALMEAGAFVTGNFDTYMMPSIADAPGAMQVFARDDLDPGDPYGPRGVGEIGIGAVTPAIAAAVADAIGAWPVATPFRPEYLLAAMRDEGEGRLRDGGEDVVRR